MDYTDLILRGRQRRNSCLFYRKDTRFGEFDKAVCEKLGCCTPTLDTCATCTLHRSCLDEKERAAYTAHSAQSPKIFFRHCHSCSSLFKTVRADVFDCGCRHSQFLEMEGR